MANNRQLISNALSNDRFLPIRLAGKRRRSSDGSRGVKAEANSSEITLFSFWFNSHNFRLPRIGVTTNVEKTNDSNIDAIDADKLGTGTTNSEEADRAEIDVVEAGGAEADRAKADRAETDRAEADRADEPSTSIKALAKQMERI